jgi:hypothetical protein
MELVGRFEERVDTFAGRDDLTKLLVSLDKDTAIRLARDYFGEGEFTATGIDGSMDFDERLQMMLFYANATGYSCPFEVRESISFKLEEAQRESKLSASAAIPLWAEDFSSVLSDMPEIDIELEHSMERIPNAFMTLAELYLATQTLERSRLIFLDRPISGTYSTLSRDVRWLLKRRESSLTRLKDKVSLLDLYLCLHLGAPETRMPRRQRFLSFAVLKKLTQNDLTLADLVQELKVGQVEFDRAIKRIQKIDKNFGGALLSDGPGGSMKVREEVKEYWNRAVTLATRYADSVYRGGGHPLSLPNDEWLTVLDVNTISFILLQHLSEEAMKKKVLLIGIAKDTTATDVTRSVLPFAIESGHLKPRANPPKLKSDRAFLTILSSTNERIRTPWRTIGYDSAFSTIIHTDDPSRKFVSARKVVSQERLFVRSFFQLRTLRSDPHLRSPVFLFDRLYDDEEDEDSTVQLEVQERSGLATIEPCFEGKSSSRLSNLVLYVLSLGDNPEVFEAYGHNQLLYLADKVVKAEVRLSRNALRAVADLRLGGVSRRKRIYGITTTYREQRSEAEEARMRAARRERQ